MYERAATARVIASSSQALVGPGRCGQGCRRPTKRGAGGGPTGGKVPAVTGKSKPEVAGGEAARARVVRGALGATTAAIPVVSGTLGSGGTGGQNGSYSSQSDGNGGGGGGGYYGGGGGGGGGSEMRAASGRRRWWRRVVIRRIECHGREDVPGLEV